MLWPCTATSARPRARPPGTALAPWRVVPRLPPVGLLSRCARCRRIASKTSRMTAQASAPVRREHGAAVGFVRVSARSWMCHASPRWWHTISAWPMPSVHTSLPVLKYGFGLEFILRYIPRDSTIDEAKNVTKPAIPSMPMMPDAAPARMATKTRLHGACTRQGSAVIALCVCVCVCVCVRTAARQTRTNS